MKDTISRQAALDALADYIHHLDMNIGTGYLSADDCMNIAKSVLGEDKLPSVQPGCEDAVSRKAVEEMLQNGFPERGMWEVEGDIVRQTVCETLADALMDLKKLPSVTPKQPGGDSSDGTAPGS